MTGEPYTAGGIRTTVARTRAATDEQLTSHVARLVAEMRAQGTTSAGDQERLRVVGPRRGAQPRRGPPVHRGHDLPRRPRRPRRSTTPEDYVDLVTGPMLAAAAPHARWIDVFCEDGAFDVDQARAILAAGSDSGLRGRLHANQLTYGGGVQLACELGLVAVDHCTFLSDHDVECAERLTDHRDAAAGRGVLHPPALPRRPPACSTPAYGSRSPATATPAPASRPRWRSASRWPSARCG